MLSQLPRRGVFFFFVFAFWHTNVISGQKIISGPDVLKNDNILSDFVILDLAGHENGHRKQLVGKAISRRDKSSTCLDPD